MCGVCTPPTAHELKVIAFSNGWFRSAPCPSSGYSTEIKLPAREMVF